MLFFSFPEVVAFWYRFITSCLFCFLSIYRCPICSIPGGPIPIPIPPPLTRLTAYKEDFCEKWGKERMKERTKESRSNSSGGGGGGGGELYSGSSIGRHVNQCVDKTY